MTDLPDRIEAVRSHYANDAALRAAVQIVPVFGGAIDKLIVGGRDKIIDARLRHFAAALRPEAEALARKAGFDEQFIQSQGYAHLLLLAFDHSARTASDEKRRLYARLLVNAATPDMAPQWERSEQLLNALGELSIGEVVVLGHVWRAYPEPILIEERMSIEGVPADEVSAYCVRLQRTGFVTVSPGQVTYTEAPMAMHVKATPLLRNLMTLLQPND